MKSVKNERMINTENNQPDFMKNRPQAGAANQIKDVYGSQKSSTRVTVTVVLTVIDLIILIIALITGNRLMIIIFAPLLVLFMVASFIGRRADRQNTPPPKQDNPDALFRDHDI